MTAKPKETSSYTLHHTYVADPAAGWTSPEEAELKTFGKKSHAKGLNKPARNIDKLSIQPIHPSSLKNFSNIKEQKANAKRTHINMKERSTKSSHVVAVQHNMRSNRRAFHLKTLLHAPLTDNDDLTNGSIDNSSSLNITQPGAPLSKPDSDTQLVKEVDQLQLNDGINTLCVDTTCENEADDTDNIPLLIPTQLADSNHIKARPTYHDIENDLHFPHTNSAWSWTSKDHKLHPLHYAAAHGNKQYLAELLTSIRNASNPLLCLANPEKSGLIDRGKIHIDMTDKDGRTSLMHAAHWSHLDCLKLLLESGADVNISTADGSSIVHQVAFAGNHAVLSLLLQYKVAKTALPDSEGRLPIHWATYAPNTKCLKLLLNHSDQNVDATDSQGMTPLMWASYMSQPDHLQVLLRQGASQCVSDADGMMAIHWSLNSAGDVENREKCFRVLLSMQSSSYKDSRGKTAAHYIAESGAPQLLTHLLAIRHNVALDRDNKGRTPLHWATVCNNKPVLVSLLDSGASKLIQDDDGKTPLDYALAKDLPECIKLLTPESEPLAQTCPTSPSTTTSECTDMNSVIFSTEKCVMKLYDVLLLRNIGIGCYLQKYTNKGKGPKHKRYFWLNIDTGQLCWAKHDNPANSDIKTLTPVDIRPSPSLTVLARRDFDSSFKHQFCFCILCTNSLINLVALNRQSYSKWVHGLKVYLTLGTELASQILRANSARLKSFEEEAYIY